jgi:hypothetical protein
MDNTDLVAIWKEILKIKEVLHSVSTASDAAKQALSESPQFKAAFTAYEKAAINNRARKHADEIALISGIVKRLESS